ncbi:MAG: ABC transporter ATP-binding protein [Opitutaceae bacterium]
MGAPGPDGAADTPPAIEIRDLVKDFAVGLRGLRLRAVDHVSLTVRPGEVFGLLGPNGSGKSTTIKLLLGLLEPTAGRCAIFGVPSGKVEARRDVGYLPEAPNFYRFLTGRELVTFYGRMCGLAGAALRGRVEEVIGLVGLAGAGDRRVGTYSKGMLQRIGLAQALVHDPRLLILDEPTAGVDPVGSSEMAELILALKARGKTVLITSHLLGQIEELCDRVAILDRGKRVAEGDVAELAGAAGRVSLETDALPPEEIAALRAWLESRGRRLEAVTPVRRRLGDVFRAYVGRGNRNTEEKR